MLSKSLLTALAGEIGGTNAQVQMMGKAGSLLSQAEPEPPEDTEEDEAEDKDELAMKAAKVKIAASLLNEVLNDS